MASCAIIRCDASPAIGYGHVMRCTAIAEQMRQQDGWQIVFVMKSDENGNAIPRQQGFRVILIQDEEDVAEARELSSIAASENADTMLLDIRTTLKKKSIEKIANEGIFIVCLDDLSDRRLAADLAIYPPIPQLKQLSWDGFSGKIHSGWEWVPLRPEFLAARQTSSDPSGHRERPSVLVTMGGSDPSGLTLRTIEALEGIEHPFDATVVLGPGFKSDGVIESRLKKSRHQYRMIKSPASMATLMRDSDLAIASFGATAYELTCVGVPSIYLCLTEDHAASAQCLVREGAAIVLGVHDQVSNADITRAISAFMQNEPMRRQMRDKAMQLIDGLGVSRISTAITQARRPIHEFA